MKNIRVLTALLILIFVSYYQAQTIKRKKTKIKKPAVVKIQNKNDSKIIIACTVNGKVVNLVTPDFPLAAKAVHVRGAVNISVLIDEKGNVIEAKAISGHPLLRANSVSAASKSSFEPVTLGGTPVQVRGIIVYNYTSDTFNWLEIGNAFGEIRFAEMLPYNFEEEKQIFRQYQKAEANNRSLIYQTLRSAIENKLIDNKKALWQFQVGIFLNKFPYNRQSDEDRKTDVTQLNILIASSPENVSRALITKLKNLLNLFETPQLDIYSPQSGSRSSQQIRDIIEKLPMLGN